MSGLLPKTALAPSILPFLAVNLRRRRLVGLQGHGSAPALCAAPRPPGKGIRLQSGHNAYIGPGQGVRYPLDVGGGQLALHNQRLHERVSLDNVKRPCWNAGQQPGKKMNPALLPDGRRLTWFDRGQVTAQCFGKTRRADPQQIRAAFLRRAPGRDRFVGQPGVSGVFQSFFICIFNPDDLHFLRLVIQCGAGGVLGPDFFG